MTIDELKRKIGTIANDVARRQADFLVLGAKLLEGEMKTRIFNNGGASNGTKIGKYKSKSWIKARSKVGNQTGFVDLEFTGDLRNSIQVVQSGDDVFLAVNNDRDYAKARFQEEQREKQIFIPTNAERKEVETYISELMVDSILDSIRKL